MRGIHLVVHLENGQRVYFIETNPRQRIDITPATTLKAFFHLCSADDFATTLLHHEVPQYYTWANNKFSRKKRGQEVEGHPGIRKDSDLRKMYSIHPNQSECLHSTNLLHVSVSTSFQSFLTVNGQVRPTYQVVCKVFDLIEDDEH